MPRSTWDLSSLTRDRTRIPCAGRQILYHWTTREVPQVPSDSFSLTLLVYHLPNTTTTQGPLPQLLLLFPFESTLQIFYAFISLKNYRVYLFLYLYVKKFPALCIFCHLFYSPKNILSCYVIYLSHSLKWLHSTS